MINNQVKHHLASQITIIIVSCKKIKDNVAFLGVNDNTKTHYLRKV